MFRKKRLLASVVTSLGLVLSLGVGASASDLGDADLVSIQALNHVHTGSENVGVVAILRQRLLRGRSIRKFLLRMIGIVQIAVTQLEVAELVGVDVHPVSGRIGRSEKQFGEWVDVTGTKYKINCGKTEQTVEGYVGLLKSVTEEGYTLSVVVDGNVSLVSSSWGGNTLEVTANGDYSCNAVVSVNGVNRNVSLAYTVEDYDTESPVVTGVEFGSRRARELSVKCIGTDNVGIAECMLEKVNE